ncbi:hypothetical protein [Lacrimispora saccharolytica]|uniref:Uncharacterized protein n=1 Tax=Lacrimispora saccharolytica (strain ATCC 35040 / DSM 2544 / NRCC 2533 / WM1) TaxID=610130 RepID=D9R5F6_LACSW|nr:hypothetical protein [Lacrimispora saccharolytica]ADL03362.1 hypothetical protein Closa_0737 [[Clostridium] saccharolyticum WM1]QRV18479.1 hypothetical protein I6K70_13085 [Lacrimispora saccharolytica]
MNAVEMSENEYYRMKAAELEKAETAFNKVKDIIENEKQRYRDIIWSKKDATQNIQELYKWKALDDLQHKIEEMLE